jgi:hypothetical protein
MMEGLSTQVHPETPMDRSRHYSDIIRGFLTLSGSGSVNYLHGSGSVILEDGSEDPDPGPKSLGSGTLVRQSVVNNCIHAV